MIAYVASAGPSKEEGKGGYNYDRNLCNGEIRSKKIQFFQDLITRTVASNFHLLPLCHGVFTDNFISRT